MADAKADKSRKPADEERDAKHDDTEASSPPKKAGPKRIAVIAGILVVQVIAAYFLQRTFLFPTSPSAKANSLEVGANTGEGTDHGGSSHAKKGEILLLDEIIVNPAETGGRRFLAITIGFEVVGDEGLQATEQRKPLVRDGIIGLLSAKRISELADIAYRDSLREEIRQKIEEELEPLEVPRVFFTGFVLQ
jgi:flagellar FliL protein